MYSPTIQFTLVKTVLHTSQLKLCVHSALFLEFRQFVLVTQKNLCRLGTWLMLLKIIQYVWHLLARHWLYMKKQIRTGKLTWQKKVLMLYRKVLILQILQSWLLVQKLTWLLKLQALQVEKQSALYQFQI